jgi:hypothetical protein
MTRNDLKVFFNRYAETDESHKFERIEVKFSKRDDLHAFMPDGHTTVSACNHDEIFLAFDVDALAEVITEEQILELVRCGVGYDSHHDALYMFV